MPAAIASEKRIKKWPRDWKKNLIERDNPAWEDLAIGLGFEPLAWPPSRPRNKSGATGAFPVMPDLFRHPPRGMLSMSGAGALRS